MSAAPVEDPLFGTGFHTMSLGDDSGTWVVSEDPVVGSSPGSNLLALGTMDPVPTLSGVGADMLVVVAWVQNPTADAEPTPGAVALYVMGPEGWEVLASISDTIVLDYLKTTSDYMAWEPAGAVTYARTTVKSLEWSTSAHFVADVWVADFPAHSDEFLAEIECDLAAALECVLLSDDGVLRLGDDSEAVLALEQKLQSIGYFGADPDTLYDATTVDWVKRFQRDYRLSVDGKAGPQTQGLVEDVAAGTSNIVMAYAEGVGSVAFGTPVESALPALVAELGTFDYSVGWEMGACGPTPPYGGWEWYKVTWGGFTAWFTEKSGSRQFDGWEVTDLDDVPTNLYFVGGLSPSSTWGYLKSLGAVYDDGYGWWDLTAFDYRLGGLVAPYGNPPANSTQVLGWGVGTAGILYDC
ncbi:MAG TPA: peptidoglycan-binding domain-containing protein, partial [Acidimicrobiia bacterium]|nr:peptidoglycan-binding domain-containing protein [Acidimicrobiia bacterium]